MVNAYHISPQRLTLAKSIRTLAVKIFLEWLYPLRGNGVSGFLEAMAQSAQTCFSIASHKQCTGLSN